MKNYLLDFLIGFLFRFFDSNSLNKFLDEQDFREMSK